MKKNSKKYKELLSREKELLWLFPSYWKHRHNSFTDRIFLIGIISELKIIREELK